MLKKIVSKHTNSKTCFACGANNPSGLKMEFYDLEDGSIAALVTAKSDHMSYPGTLHGGIVATILDEALGRSTFTLEPDTWCVTLEVTVKYKKPVPYDVELRVAARVVEDREKVFICEGEVLLPDDSVAAAARGVYYKANSNAAEAGMLDMEMTLREVEPTEIDLPEPPSPPLF